MSDFYELVNSRATCRSYTNEAIAPEALERILEAACRSPSSGGFQAVSIVVVDDEQKRKKLVEYSRGQKFIATAPVSLVFCVDYRRMQRVIDMEPAPFRETEQLKNFWMSLIDVAVMAQTAVLAAQEEGLGSYYNGNIINVADRVSEMLELPDLVFPAIMLTLGYPMLPKQQMPKYPTEILVHRNSYSDLPDEELYKAYRKQNRYHKFTAKPQRVERCCAMAEQLHGKDFAESVRRDIEEKGYIGQYQYWFGCYYDDEPGFMSEQDYLRFFRNRGFHWLPQSEE